MKELYWYNKNTHTLHINNFCTNAQSCSCVKFDSEDEALKYAGRALGMCKICMKKRDALLLDYIKKMKSECEE